MEHFIIKNNKKLRYGYTTGSSATAAAKACAIMLLTQKKVESVVLNTPKGIRLNLKTLFVTLEDTYVRCAVRKDSGDDPDITNGVLIFAKVRLIKKGIDIDGGQGVGRVTLKGLKCKVGEAAINPKPKEMIVNNLMSVAHRYGYKGGFSVLIEVPDGKRLSQKTFNGKLGVVGGISILGTSGIVEPMSSKALKESIELEISVLNEKGYSSLIFCPGNYGMNFAKNTLKLPACRVVKVSNYIGGMLEAAKEQGVKKVLLVSHIGKGIKLAAGMLNTHSKYGDCRMEILTAYAVKQDVTYYALKEILTCVTTDAAIDILIREGKMHNILSKLVNDIENRLTTFTDNRVKIGIVLFNTTVGILGISKRGEKMLEEFRTYE